MNTTRQLHRRPTDWLYEGPLAPYVEAFTHYLSKRRYAPHTIDTYLSCIAHFARWMSQCRLDAQCIDEDVVQQFLNNHLPRCTCAKPAPRTRSNLRAALRHLLVVLRAEAVITEPLGVTTQIDEELRHFDEHMNHVRGLVPATRRLYLCTVRRLLLAQFGRRAVVISAITPEDVRRFIASQRERYSTPGSAGSLISALRGYFRFRITRGDQMHALIGVASYPANWQLASLPKALSNAEIGCLVDSLAGDGPSARSNYAEPRAVAKIFCRCRRPLAVPLPTI